MPRAAGPAPERASRANLPIPRAADGQRQGPVVGNSRRRCRQAPQPQDNREVMTHQPEDAVTAPPPEAVAAPARFDTLPLDAKLLRAIVDGNAELAAELALEHVVGFEQEVRAVL